MATPVLAAEMERCAHHVSGQPLKREAPAVWVHSESFLMLYGSFVLLVYYHKIPKNTPLELLKGLIL